MQNIEIINDGSKIVGKLSHVGFEKLVILVHGFTGNMHGPDNLFDNLRDELTLKEYSVFQFNFRGTYPSEMSFEKMTLKTESQDLKKVIEDMNSRGYKSISLVGGSMGVSVILANSGFEKIESIVLWYGAFNFIETSFKEYLTGINKKQIQETGSLDVGNGFSIGKQFFDEIETIQLLESAKEITCPVLFLHGNKDTDCNYKDSMKAYELVPHDKKDIYIIGGEDHCFRTSHGKVIQLTLQFLQQYF